MKYTMLLITLLVPCTATAAFPEGQWAVNNIVDIVTSSTVLIPGTSKPQASLYRGFSFCIQHDHTWYGTIDSNGIKGSGRWNMKGNNIHLHMNRKESYGTFSESIELTKVSSTVLTGYWQQWNINDTYDDYMTTKWTFVSSTCKAKA
jgi:hypothetical protein